MNLFLLGLIGLCIAEIAGAVTTLNFLKRIQDLEEFKRRLAPPESGEKPDNGRDASNL